MGNATCGVPDCERRRHGRQQYCKLHYSRWVRNGHTDRVAVYRSVCGIEGCGKPHLSRGMCPMHYRRWKFNGDPNVVQKVRDQGVCYADACLLKSESLGLCGLHYRRMRAHGSTDLPPREVAPCSVDTCSTAAVSRGLCNKHYRRLRAHGPDGLTKGDPRVCGREDCDAPFYAQELCRQHWSDGYRARNRARIALHSSRRRERSGSGMTEQEITAALEYRLLIAGNPCAYCGSPSDTVDHIEAVHVGGTDRWMNLAAACQSCNSSKKTKSPLEFMLWRLSRSEGARHVDSARRPAGAV